MGDRQAILIVEDDAKWQEILKESLEGGGYEITIVAGYQDARQALDARSFDLVILDLQLDEAAPLLDGERLLAHISRLYPGTPCIVVSGRGDTRIVRNAFKQYRVVDYIAKDHFDIPAFVNAALAALTTAPDPVTLRRALDDQFDLEEVKNLCFDLGIDFDDLRGEGKKAREVVAYCQRRGRLQDLAAHIANR